MREGIVECLGPEGHPLPSTKPRRSSGPEDLMTSSGKQFSLPGIQPFAVFLGLS
jgi:hypothetical protein